MILFNKLQSMAVYSYYLNLFLLKHIIDVLISATVEVIIIYTYIHSFLYFFHSAYVLYNRILFLVQFASTNPDPQSISSPYFLPLGDHVTNFSLSESTPHQEYH